MEKARVIFIDCPEHVDCLAAMCFETYRHEEHEMKRRINETQWPWAQPWLRQHPRQALSWVNHNPNTMTAAQVAATADWDEVVVLDYSREAKGVLV